MAKRRVHRHRSTQRRKLAAMIADGLREGTLQLKDIAGLTSEELSAIAQAGERCCRAGQLAEASTIFGALIALDPLQPAYWQAIGEIQQQRGNHQLAVACFEFLARLSERTADNTRRQAESLRHLNEPALADAALALANSLPNASRWNRKGGHDV